MSLSVDLRDLADQVHDALAASQKVLPSDCSAVIWLSGALGHLTDLYEWAAAGELVPAPPCSGP